MSDEEQIDEAVDRVINDALAKDEITDDEIKKRRPKPFRYITDENEIRQELEEAQQETVMRGPDQPNITNDEWFILGLGDMQTIENVIRRHQMSRKTK